MIGHLIKSDFRSFKLYWIFLIPMTLLGVLGIHQTESGWQFLFVFYFLFGLAPLSQLTGVTWRSQHIMSRNYLLSLPIERKRFFKMIQIRAMVYQIPLLLLGSVAPFFHANINKIISKSQIHYPLYALMIFLSLIWWVNSIMGGQIIMERVTSFLTQKQRTIAMFKHGGLTCLEVMVVGLCNTFLILTGNPLLIFPVLALSAFRFFWTRKNWLGTR